MRLQAGVGRFPGRVGGQELGHVRLRAAGQACVVEFGGLEAHQVRRANVRMRLGQGELYALVLSDRPPEHDPLAGVGAALIHEPVAIPDAFGRDQDALGVEPVEQRPETLALLADQVLHGYFQAIEEDLAGVVVEHGAQGADLDPSSR